MKITGCIFSVLSVAGGALQGLPAFLFVYLSSRKTVPN
jgi:hypothetical protein